MLTVPARRSQELLKLYGGMPAVESQQDAFLQSASQADYTQPIDWKVAKEGVNHADVPNFECYTPAYNETLDLINTFGTKWQATPGLNLDTEIADLKSQLQAIWDKGGLIHGRHQRRPPARPRPACPGWPGGGRAGATSSSRRGSSGSCSSPRSR